MFWYIVPWGGGGVYTNECFDTLHQVGGGGLYTNECFDTLYRGGGGLYTNECFDILYQGGTGGLYTNYWLCQFLMKIILVINWMCACAKTSVEDDNFLRDGWGGGGGEPNDFYLIW